MQDDFLIALAWPEGMVTASGAWYDKFFSTNGKYRVGHSAVVLVERSTGQLVYFDFGRYHSPNNYGRVRDVQTDNDVAIKSLAEINGDRINNLKRSFKR